MNANNKIQTFDNNRVAAFACQRAFICFLLFKKSEKNI